MALPPISTWRLHSVFLPLLAIGIAHIATFTPQLMYDENYPMIFEECGNYKRAPIFKQPIPVLAPTTCFFVSQWQEMLAVPRSRTITASIFSVLAALFSIYHLESARLCNRRNSLVLRVVLTHPTPWLIIFHGLLGGLAWEFIIIPALFLRTRTFILSQTKLPSRPGSRGIPRPTGNGNANSKDPSGPLEPVPSDLINNTEVVAITAGVGIGFILPTVLMLIDITNPYVVLFWNGFPIWVGFEEPCTVWDDWGHLLRAVIDQTFSSPLDLVKAATALNAGLKSEASSNPNIDLYLMGPSCHAAYFIEVLKSGRHISVVENIGNRNEDFADTSQRIAIVGMGGRGPGSTGNSASDDLDHYWNVILTGRDLVSEIPPGRFDAPHLFEAQNMSHNGQKSDGCVSTTKFGCFLANPGHFDARFFSISPREAMMMDPGSRLFQMAAVEALQMAGYSCGQTRTTDPSRIAVFYGQSDDDGYVTAHHEKGCDAYTLQAAQRAFAPGRVAFHHGWEGPTWAIDCACSTSSSLIHSACKSLLAREIDMAVAGAANVLAFPHGFCGMSKSGCLSATGNCKTFRDDADGYCRGEFVGAVVLKRLEDAMAHNDNILAVIAGSARNQSGNALYHKVRRRCSRAL